MWILPSEQRWALISLANPQNGLAVHGLRLKYILSVNHLKDFSFGTQHFHSPLELRLSDHIQPMPFCWYRRLNFINPFINAPKHTCACKKNQTFPLNIIICKKAFYSRKKICKYTAECHTCTVL